MVHLGFAFFYWVLKFFFIWTGYGYHTPDMVRVSLKTFVFSGLSSDRDLQIRRNLIYIWICYYAIFQTRLPTCRQDYIPQCHCNRTKNDLPVATLRDIMVSIIHLKTFDLRLIGHIEVLYYIHDKHNAYLATLKT